MKSRASFRREPEPRTVGFSATFALVRPCAKTVTLSPSAALRINSAKDLPCVAHLGETLRQARGDTPEVLLRQNPLVRKVRLDSGLRQNDEGE